jgi:tRNA nucleotidyltransferase (CCA-adding enzyme)
MTHEQADFDALGALLGASLLQGSAIAVLPRRMNRNVRSFITLYGVELPFVDPPDLPQEAIDQVTLVDTQSLITLRGLGSKTQVNIVDHHPTRSDLDPDWVITTDKTGAATTIFVERLQDLGYVLSLIQSTLLLLGIYEDTGSLTYTSTTPRDVRAAAFLLEQGASLNLAAGFLNTPLSDDQRRIYEILLRNCKTEQINGQTVVIGCADAEGMIEEVSSVAHKMRDLLDPDALFILVETSEGIRLVARSTSNQVNVAKVAALYGGGGHDRAAAALIHRGESLGKGRIFNRADEVAADLRSVLPDLIRPAVTVGQMMSRRPHLLKLDASAEQASNLMQRYGYEGYPVVENGRIKGLLTRRAVDRALSHKLNLPAASLMEAGSYTVLPTDGIEHLQEVMTESGWGQIPVVHPETREIIGIVTRTDLLKILSKEPRQRANRNLAKKLEAALPASRLALLKAVAASGHTQRMALYIVGGFVRDLLLERPSFDFDVVVEGDAIALGKTLAEQFGGRIVSHARFGTAKWSIYDCKPQVARKLGDDGSLNPADLPDSLDLISARTEFYDYPTALPKVERSSIKLDLHRRDFTINTLALRLDGRHYGELLDFWGGLNDLHRRQVRVLHSISFIDDPTRALRAVRFEKRFDFKIETRTLQLLEEARGQLKQVTGERLRHELDLILAEEQAISILNRLSELDILHCIHPGLDWTDRISAGVDRVLSEPPPPVYDIGDRLYGLPSRRVLAYLTWFGQLPIDQARAVGRRLRFSGHLMTDVIAICRYHTNLEGLIGLRPSQVVSRLDGFSPAVIYCLQNLSPQIDQREILHQYAERWRKLIPGVNGHDLARLGVPPGSIYRDILSQLRIAWLDGVIHTPEEEKEFLDRVIQSRLLSLEQSQDPASYPE